MKNYDPAEAREQRTFSLRGQEFTAKPAMPGDAFDDLADIQSGTSKTVRLYEAFGSIIGRSLIAADRERWHALLADDLDVPIEVMTLAEIADDLVSAVNARPPASASPSGSTGDRTQTPSTENSGSPEGRDSTLSRSVPV